MVSILGATQPDQASAPPPCLSWYSDIRVYYKNESERAQIESVVLERFHSDVSIEWIHAPICRDELMVEIEGLALIPHCARDHM